MDGTVDRPHRRRRGAVLAAAAGLLAVVATQLLGLTSDVAPDAGSVAASDPPAPSDGAVVPWSLRLAPQGVADELLPEPTQAPAPACRSDDVSVAVADARQDPTEGDEPAPVLATVLLTNDGPTCQLRPLADGVLLDEDGSTLPLNRDVGRDAVGYVDPPPLPAGDTASADMTWDSWCGEDPGRWSLRLVLPDGSVVGDVEGPAPAAPGCWDGFSDGVYAFGTWTVLDDAGRPALDPQSALTASVTGPGSGHLGEVLPMVLRLTNPTRGSIALDPCPRFTWSVSDSGPGSYLRSSPELELNCPAALGDVPAGGSLDFDLELALSPALADGSLASGQWWVHPSFSGAEPRRIEVLPARDPEPAGTVTCSWVVPPDADPLVPGVPPTTAARTVREAVLRTNRGDLRLELDGRTSPCAVQAFVHHVEGGYWQDQPCYMLSTQPGFGNVDCGLQDLAPVRAGFAFPSEARAGSTYPAGTVVLTHNETLPHAGSIRILYADAPTYAANFTVLGRITDGLPIIEEVGASGHKDGEYSGPRLELRISGVDLLG